MTARRKPIRGKGRWPVVAARARAGLVVAAAVALVAGALPAAARTVTVSIAPSQVRALDALPGGTARAWLLPVDLPRREPGERVMAAWLDVAVDAGADVEKAALGGAVTLEVFGLDRVVRRTVSAADVRAGAMKRTVEVGTNRRVRVDVTRFVRDVLEDGRANLGLVVGAVTGARLGHFALRTDALGADVAARVVVELERPVGPPRYRR